MTIAPPLDADNPLVEGLERLPAPPTTLTIFGATGDLSKRKLLPAIYNLAHEGALPERFNLIGVSRRDLPDDDFRAMARDAITEFSRRTPDPAVLDGLLERFRYIGFSFDDQPGYTRLRAALDAADEQAGLSLNRAFYLSTAPEFFPVIIEALGAAGLNAEDSHEVRVDHREAVRHRPRQRPRAAGDRVEELSRASGLPHRSLPRQGDRAEHAGVPLRQLHVRAGVEPQLHRSRPDHRRRGRSASARARGYYDNAGALRDMVQNHMLQLLTLVCMEPPSELRLPRRSATRRSRCCRRSRRRRPSR